MDSDRCMVVGDYINRMKMVGDYINIMKMVGDYINIMKMTFFFNLHQTLKQH